MKLPTADIAEGVAIYIGLAGALYLIYKAYMATQSVTSAVSGGLASAGAAIGSVIDSVSSAVGAAPAQASTGAGMGAQAAGAPFAIPTLTIPAGVAQPDASVADQSDAESARLIRQNGGLDTPTGNLVMNATDATAQGWQSLKNAIQGEQANSYGQIPVSTPSPDMFGGNGMPM